MPSRSLKNHRVSSTTGENSSKEENSASSNIGSVFGVLMIGSNDVAAGRLGGSGFGGRPGSAGGHTACRLGSVVVALRGRMTAGTSRVAAAPIAAGIAKA